jgi:hypothetical protein
VVGDSKPRRLGAAATYAVAAYTVPSGGAAALRPYKVLGNDLAHEEVGLVGFELKDLAREADQARFGDGRGFVAIR